MGPLLEGGMCRALKSELLGSIPVSPGHGWEGNLLSFPAPCLIPLKMEGMCFLVPSPRRVLRKGLAAFFVSRAEGSRATWGMVPSNPEVPPSLCFPHGLGRWREGLWGIGQSRWDYPKRRWPRLRDAQMSTGCLNLRKFCGCLAVCLPSARSIVSTNSGQLAALIFGTKPPGSWLNSLPLLWLKRCSCWAFRPYFWKMDMKAVVGAAFPLGIFT